MPRVYQRKTGNPYALPHNTYMRTVYVVRDYDRLRSQRAETARRRVGAVERALGELPPEYRKGVFEYMARGRAYPITAGIATWRRQQQKFVWHVAALLDEC